MVRYEIFGLREGETTTVATRLAAAIQLSVPAKLAIVPEYGNKGILKAAKYLVGDLASRVMFSMYGPPMPSANEVFGGAYTVYCDTRELGQRVIRQTASVIMESKPSSLTLGPEQRSTQLRADFRREILNLPEAQSILNI